MATRVYWSRDNGALYMDSDLGDTDPGDFVEYELADYITLTPRHMAIGLNDVLEILLQAGVARKVESP